MDTRLSNTAAQLPLPTTRLDVAAPKSAVRTELVAPAVVTAQVGVEQSRFNRERRLETDANKRSFDSSLDVDKETGELVYRVIDPSSRVTVLQYPYEGLLKLRAYMKAQAKRK